MTEQLALTPPMGWNSWNTFGSNINESLVKEIADAMVTKGLKEVGYTYVNLDDHWQAGRDNHGRLYPDPAKFPSGMPALADYVHSRGLKFGLYSDAGEKTCGGQVGSMGHEEMDAETFASWGVDFLKYDFCYAPSDRGSAEHLYRKMGDALKKAGTEAGRPILFSICEWGFRRPWLWGRDVGGHMWRATNDIWDGWLDGEKVYQNGILTNMDLARGLEAYAGPGGWNDLDMLVVGIHGHGNTVGAKVCSDNEYKTHFAMWCMLASPLIIGCDVRSMDEITRSILTNADLIALNQDPAGKQAYRVITGRQEVYKKPLADGSLGVALFNRADETQPVIAHRSDLEIEGQYQVKDLWSHQDMGTFDEVIKADVEPHACLVYRLTAK